MRIKTTMGQHFTSTRMAFLNKTKQKQQNPKHINKDVEKSKSLCPAYGKANWNTALWKTGW